MTPDFYASLALAGVALLTAGTSSIAALGVRRIIKGTDELKATVQSHTVQIAEMKLKMPNGEWKAIKESVAMVQNDIAAVHTEVRETRGDLAKHVLDESTVFLSLKAGLKNERAEAKADRVRPRRARKARR